MAVATQQEDLGTPEAGGADPTALSFHKHLFSPLFTLSFVLVWPSTPHWVLLEELSHTCTGSR